MEANGIIGFSTENSLFYSTGNYWLQPTCDQRESSLRFYDLNEIPLYAVTSLSIQFCEVYPEDHDPDFETEVFEWAQRWVALDFDKQLQFVNDLGVDNVFDSKYWPEAEKLISAAQYTEVDFKLKEKRKLPPKHNTVKYSFKWNVVE